MDYGDLLRQAWNVIWKAKFLILFGVLVVLGGAGGSGNLNWTTSWREGNVHMLDRDFRLQDLQQELGLPPRLVAVGIVILIGIALVIGLLLGSFVEYAVHRLMHRGTFLVKRHARHHRNFEAQGWWGEFSDYALPGLLIAWLGFLVSIPAGTGFAATPMM